MNESENGVRAIQRLRETLLEERGRMVPVRVETTVHDDWLHGYKTVEIGGNKEALDNILRRVDESENEYELCLTFRKRPNNKP